MKAVLLALLGFMCVGGVNVMSAERPTRGRMKGVELYSWPEHGKWMFVLLDGTNRLKSEEEVKKSPNRVDTVAALGAQFMELAKGETVVWNFHFVPGFSFPDKKSFAEITAAAKRAEINLIPDRNKEDQSVATLHIKWPEPKEDFDPNQLSDFQRMLCGEFRNAAADKCKKSQFDALLQAEALPYKTRRIGKAHVIALLGPPHLDEGSHLTYFLGPCKGGQMVGGFQLFEDRVVALWFSTTL